MPGTVWIAEEGDHELVQAQLEPSPGNTITMTLTKWGDPVTVTNPRRDAAARQRVSNSRDQRGQSRGSARRARHLRRRHDHDRHHARCRHRINKSNGSPRSSPATCSATSRRCRCSVEHRTGSDGRLSSRPAWPDSLSARWSPRCPPTSRPWSSAASSRAPPVARCCPSRWRWPRSCGPRGAAQQRSGYRCRTGTGQRARPHLRHRPVSLFSTWQAVFWSMCRSPHIAMVMIHFSLPRGRDDRREKVDVVGGLLLAIALGLAVIGLYNPDPDGRQVLPDWGMPRCSRRAGARRVLRLGKGRPHPLARSRRSALQPFLAALGASVTAGAALMVTLVNVELFGQGVLGRTRMTPRSCCCAFSSRCRSGRCSADGLPPGSATDHRLRGPADRRRGYLLISDGPRTC